MSATEPVTPDEGAATCAPTRDCACHAYYADGMQVAHLAPCCRPAPQPPVDGPSAPTEDVEARKAVAALLERMGNASPRYAGDQYGERADRVLGAVLAAGYLSPAQVAVREREAAAKAWDEGYVRGTVASFRPLAEPNPYARSKGVTTSTGRSSDQSSFVDDKTTGDNDEQ